MGEKMKKIITTVFMVYGFGCLVGYSVVIAQVLNSLFKYFLQITHESIWLHILCFFVESLIIFPFSLFENTAKLRGSLKSFHVRQPHECVLFADHDSAGNPDLCVLLQTDVCDCAEGLETILGGLWKLHLRLQHGDDFVCGLQEIQGAHQGKTEIDFPNFHFSLLHLLLLHIDRRVPQFGGGSSQVRLVHIERRDSEALGLDDEAGVDE